MALLASLSPSEQPTTELLRTLECEANDAGLWNLTVICSERFSTLDIFDDWAKSECMGGMVECTLTLGIKPRTAEPKPNWRKA
jgi:hypothetical protein